MEVLKGAGDWLLRKVLKPSGYSDEAIDWLIERGEKLYPQRAEKLDEMLGEAEQPDSRQTHK